MNSKPKAAAAKRPKWRAVPDEIILALCPQQLQRAESLCPSASTVERAASGDPIAVAIAASWRPIFVIRVVTTWRD